MQDPSEPPRRIRPDRTVGLCATCRHARVKRSARGSAFWRCGLSDEDGAYLRYPPLPVERCPGYEPGEAARGSRAGSGRPRMRKKSSRKR